MKKTLMLVLCMFIVIFLNCENGNDNSETGSTSGEKIWDWTDPAENILYVENSFVGKTIYKKQLPYFTSDSSPASDDLYKSLDIMPEYGWELIAKDFGNKKNYVKMPWFALYNRARGILRLFYFNTMSDQFKYGVATITTGDGIDSKLGIFNAFKVSDSSQDDYYTGQNWNGIECIHKIDSEKWCYADFELSYDPDVQKDTNLTMKIFGVKETSVVNDATLEQYILSENIGTDLFSSFFNTISFSTGYYKDIASALDKINAILKPASLITAISAKSGFVSNYSKGIYNDHVVSMSYSGHFKFNGSINDYTELETVKIHAPGSTRETLDNIIHPEFDEPLGIISFKTKPKLGFKVNKKLSITMAVCILKNYVECGLIEPIQLIINYPAIEKEIMHFNKIKGKRESYSFKIKSIEAAAVYSDGKSPTDYIDKKVNQFIPIDEFYQKHNFFLDPVEKTSGSYSISNSLFYVGGNAGRCQTVSGTLNTEKSIYNLPTKILIAVRLIIEPVHIPSKYNHDGTYYEKEIENIEIIKVIRPSYILNPK